MQGNRLLELLDTMPDLQVYVMNTGRVGGGDADERSKKVRISDSSAIVEGIVSDTIAWVDDPDFGYQIAASVRGIDDIELLQPKRLYERQARVSDYDAIVMRLKQERTEYLARYSSLDSSVGAAI